MPTPMDLGWDDFEQKYHFSGVPVATQEELLDFCNKFREAAGADILPHLLPASKGDMDYCLIARGMNFSCSVNGSAVFNDAGRPVLGEEVWYMYVGENAPQAKLILAADKLGLKWEYKERNEGMTLKIALPEEIGYAARAFDEGKAFNSYVED